MFNKATTMKRRLISPRQLGKLPERRADRAPGEGAAILKRGPLVAPASSQSEAITSWQLQSLCLSRPECGRVIRFMWTHPTTLMTIPDISGCAGLSHEETDNAVESLHGMGLLRRVDASGLAFYGITTEPELRRAVGRFEAWREAQRQRWESLREVLV